MKKNLIFTLIFSLFLCSAQNSQAVGLNAVYISNNDPQFIALCAVGATLAGAGIYAGGFAGIATTISGIALILASKEILLAVNKKMLQYQLKNSKEVLSEKLEAFFS